MLGETLGNYRITGKLGEGGMGVVYLAEHVTLGSRAAVKMLLAELSANQEMVQRFFNEARSSTLIKHPGIVGVFDFGRHAATGSAYLVMEMLEGESLASRLRRERMLPAPLVAVIARQVASALAAAHDKGIVHRDLKPDNLFLCPERDAPAGLRVKILDFGIAKLAGEAAMGGSVRTRTGSVMGTPIYMSPEQCEGAALVDARSDVYSLGCILYEMAAGRPPFTHTMPGQIMAAHMRDVPQRLSALAPAVPAMLDALVMRMLEKSLDARPQSMEEVIGVLEAGGVGSGGYAAVAPMAAGPSAPTIAAARPTTLGGAAGQLATAPVRTPGGSLVPLVIMGVVVVAAVAGVVVYMKKGKDSGAQPSPTATVTASPSPSPSQSPSPVLDPRSKEIEDTLASARRALAEEHWAGAIASAEVVLKLAPDNQEAQDIRERAKKAERNHVIYQEFRDAVQAKKHAEAVLLYGKLVGSAFEDEAAPELEKLRDDFLAPFVASAKKHLAAKKCSDIARDATKVEKVVPEWRKVIDDIGKGCTTLKPSASPSPSPSTTPSASAAAGAAPAAAKRDPNDLIPPKAPVPDSDCEAGVQAAQEDYVHGNYAGAIEKARKAARGTCVARAWRLIGASSCFLKDKSGAVAAWNRLPNTDRKFLEYVCARNSIEMP